MKVEEIVPIVIKRLEDGTHTLKIVEGRVIQCVIECRKCAAISPDNYGCMTSLNKDKTIIEELAKTHPELLLWRELSPVSFVSLTT